MTLNCWSSCLHLPSAGIEGESHHSQPKVSNTWRASAVYTSDGHRKVSALSEWLRGMKCTGKGKEDENLFTVPLCSVKDTNIYKFLCHFKLTSKGRLAALSTWRLFSDAHFFFPVLTIKPRTSCMLSKCCHGAAGPSPATVFNYLSGDLNILWDPKCSFSMLLALSLFWY